MKNLLKYSTIASLLIVSAISNAEQNNLYTEKGYPYKDLVLRSQEVKLIYSQNDQNITCKVSVDTGKGATILQSHIVEPDKFQQAPLASCLLREDAIELLAETFRS